MEGFRFCKKDTKWFWRIGFVILGIGVSTLLIALGIGIVFLYDHLVWQ